MNFPRPLKFGLLTMFSLALSGCLSSPSNETVSTDPSNTLITDSTNTQYFAVVATVEPAFTGGAHSIVEMSGHHRTQNDFSPTASSDLHIVGRSNYLYRIEKFNADNITKFDIGTPGTPIWQYSTMDDNDGPAGENISSSNPYSMVFANSSKAYVLRYGSKRAWIVNPSAQDEGSFKIGELDLSSYADADGFPEMSYGIIINNKLFILMQRLDSWQATQPAYIAVFDINTGAEIDTLQGSGGLKGIELDVRDPSSRMVYNDGYLYVTGAPDTLWASGIPAGMGAGIQRIDVNTYEPEPIIYSGHNITSIAVVSSTKAYFVEYSGWNNTSLKSFNPSTGLVSAGNVAGLGDSGDRNLSDLAISPDGKLWIADGSLTQQGIYIVNTDTGALEDGPISTNLNPVNISFCSYSR